MKKVISMIVTVFIVMTACSAWTLAEDTELLELDNNRIYPGMTSSFSDGYSPVQNGDSVTILLPLVLVAAGTPIAGDITVTPDLGADTSSPFVFNNYQKSFSLETHTTDKGGNPAYLVQFTLPLSADRIKGRYPVVLNVAYRTADGKKYSQQFTIYTILDGQDPEPTEIPAETPRFQPKLIMSGYKVTPEIVEAGQEFEIAVTIRNTSQEFDARNITVRYGGDGVDILPAGDTNIQYVSLIKRGGSVVLTFRMVSRLESTAGIQKIALNIEYEDSKANAYSMSDEIFFQITHPISIEPDAFETPATINAGDSLSLNFAIFNKSRGRAYNVMCKITGKGILAESSVFIGTMEPGSTGRAEINAFVGTLDMSPDDGESTGSSQADDAKYGATSGVVTITYEDEFGKEYSQEILFDITIIPPVTKTSTSEETTEKVDKVSQWWVSVLIAGLIIAGLVASVVINRRRRAKATSSDGTDR